MSDGEGWHWETFKKGEVVMKRILLVLITATLLLTLASPGEAWQVTFTNNCRVTRYENGRVWGQHLFWISWDCLERVDAGVTKTCVVPNAICPAAFGTDVHAYNCSDGKAIAAPSRTFEASTCCWNLNVEIYDGGDSTCHVRLK